ncbi:MAG TPA: putative lipid II flippase FtsW [Steroidobacteraceae bacterium]|nr:putative lipid II flippase FtsW [Steroidobacteraceae bacterium]
MNAIATAVNRPQERHRLLRLDVPMLLLVAAILLLGLVMVTSASITAAARESGDPLAYLERQLLLVAAGLALAALIFAIPIALIERCALPLLIVAGVLLLLVLVPGLGHVVKGGRRWLRLPGINFQVSEAARVLALVYIAHYCVRFEAALRGSCGGLLRPLLLLALLGALLLAEPDLGAATVLFITGFGLLFLAGAQLRWVIAAVLGSTALLSLLVMFSDYRMRRVTGFLDPWADPYNTGFQLTQSLIAIGRGEWFGVGLGASVQKLFYLPEAHNDFLFAVLAEELGLVGVVLTLGLFLALAWRVFALARRANDAGMKFHAYLASGFGLWLLVQAFVNIGVNMGVLPTKGLTLPFMSYGRSSMIVALAWLGLVLRVHHEVAGGARAVARGRLA